VYFCALSVFITTFALMNSQTNNIPRPLTVTPKKNGVSAATISSSRADSSVGVSGMLYVSTKNLCNRLIINTKNHFCSTNETADAESYPFGAGHPSKDGGYVGIDSFGK
jgi:hypothetical protein